MNKFDILPSIPSKNQNFSMPKSKDDMAHKNDSTNLDPKHQKPKNQDRSRSTPDNSATPESDD